MNQVSKVLRRATTAYFHWCPACDKMHRIPDRWAFNGNLDRPTFTPSLRHTNGQGWCCHYRLTDGVLNFCADCSHAMSGKSVPLPPLPPELEDVP